MSSLGVLIVILAVFLLLNADKLAWVLMGHLKLNTQGYDKDGQTR